MGYCSDITRTVVVGDLATEVRDCYEVLRAAQQAAVTAVAIGVAAADIDAAARAVITDAGLGDRFIHRTGHGIGIEEHEDPYVVAGNLTPLERGHAFSIEPGIYLPGRFGMRLEDIVVVSESGADPLNTGGPFHGCRRRLTGISLPHPSRKARTWISGSKARLRSSRRRRAASGRRPRLALAAEGARVVITARGEESLAKAEEELRLAGADVFAVAVDVTRPDSPAQLVAAAIQRWERLDIVVANAGGPPPGSALEIDDDALRLAFEANTLTSIRLVREALPHLRAGGWGRLCCITSYSVVQPIPGLALSNTARTGLWAWAKTAAADIAALDPAITLNIVCPGAHATDRMIELGGGSDGARLGDPDEFGRVVAFLCSQPAAYINGAAIVVDGGATLAL